MPHLVYHVKSYDSLLYMMHKCYKSYDPSSILINKKKNPIIQESTKSYI